MSAESFFRSARANWDGILKRKGSDPCSLIVHYSDVVVESEVAVNLAPEGSVTQEHAEKLGRTAGRAMRGAIAACRLGRRGKRR
jgi:hypothetical protein